MKTTQARITKHIQRFDPVSLLMLLTHIGYSLDDILFCSHFSACSQSRLIQAIEFSESPDRKVVITLNMGLLGGQSLLPNYLFKQVKDNNIDEERFAEFFGYLDDRLLRGLLLAIYPEIDNSIYPDWQTRKTTALQTLKLDSKVCLHWLTQQVFPELQVRIEKAGIERNIDLGAPILGKSRLGYQAVLGKTKKISVPGKRITLITDEAQYKKTQPWAQEITKRLHNLMFPLLAELDMDLEIWLMIRSQSTSLDLKPNSYLGYENIHSDQLQVRNIRVFSGHLCAAN